jgi:hypothetical protein
MMAADRIIRDVELRQRSGLAGFGKLARPGPSGSGGPGQAR